MKLSNNNNIVSCFICRNQDKLPMKFLDTLFQMSKREFRFSGEKIRVIGIKRNTFINDLKFFKFPVFKVLDSTCSHLHQRVQQSCKAPAIAS